jgi:RNA polymerase sigma factor (sigma-70 family)
MIREPFTSVLCYLRGHLSTTDAVSEDAQLLGRFARCGEVAAFEVLLHRHGPLVWSVCRRLLACEQDAEDAFQATFLVLLRRASSLRKQASVASFLYGVAYRIAARTRANSRRQVAADLSATAALMNVPAEASAREVQCIVEEEIARLPEWLRAPVVLCCLEGQSKGEAALHLRLREGTVASRLARARSRLRTRLLRRGVPLTATLVTLLSEQTRTAAVPPAAAAAARRLAACVAAGEAAAADSVSEPVAALADRGLRALAVTRLKLAMVLGLVVGILMVGAGWAAHQVLAAKPPGQAGTEARPPQTLPARKVRLDYYGDPLPQGAIARMGTVRRRHEGALLAFSADGKALITAGSDAAVGFWDVTTGKLKRRTQVIVPTIPHSEPGVSVAALSADGKLLATFVAQTVYLSDTTTGKELRRLPVGGVGHRHAAFSRDGKLLATLVGAADQYVLRLWETATGKERFALRNRTHATVLGFSSDGKLLATRDWSAGGYVLHVWDTATGRERGQVRNEDGQAAFSPDGKTLASGDRFGTVTLWETATLKKKATLKPQTTLRLSSTRGTPVALSYSPAGTLLAVAGDRAVVLWNVAARKERHRLAERESSRLAFAPDGKTLACAGDFETHLWDVATGQRLDYRPGHGSNVRSVAVSPDGKLVASAESNSPVVRLWDAVTGKPLPTTLPHHDFVRSCAFSADGKFLVTGSGSGNGMLRLWKTTGEEVRRFVITGLDGRPARHEVLVCHLSRDGKRLAAVSTTYERNREHVQMSVWDAQRGTVLMRRPFRGHLSSRFTPDGRGATVDSRERLLLEDTLTGQELATVPGDLGRPVAFSPDTALVAVGIHKTLAPDRGYQQKGVRMAELATGEEIFSVEGWLDFVAFSPDGSILAMADADALRLWDAFTGKQLFRRSWPKGLVRRPLRTPIGSLDFLPGGRALVTGMGDGTLLVWDLEPATWAKDKAAEALGRKEIEALWTDLAGDARKAHRAMPLLAAAPRQTVAFLKEHLQPVAPVDPKRVAQLLADLESRKFSVREQAFKELTRFGQQIEPALRRVLEGKPPIEMRKRVEALQVVLRGAPPSAVVRVLRSIRVLERIGTQQARELLKVLAAGVPAARETREARAALERRP